MQPDTPSDLEREAVRLRFHYLNPEAPTNAEPDPEQFENLLEEVRNRQRTIEREALTMLGRKLRTPGGRSGVASRHTVALFRFLALPAIAVLGFLAIAMLIFAWRQ